MRITARDRDIFQFLLEQKFASLEAIYFRFFDRRRHAADPLPREFFVTRQRLGRLCKAGLLVTERVYTESKSLFRLALNGYHVLKQASREVPYALPVKSVDFRSFDHDLRVTYCRVALERSRRAVQWISERQIRKNGLVLRGSKLPTNVVPDGVFLTANNQWIAFELESSNRKASRFDQKALDYHHWLSSGLVDHVLWVACDAAILQALKNASGYFPKFTLATYDEFSRQLFPGGKP